jgi:capsular polysaccharide biosynthesis protein
LTKEKVKEDLSVSAQGESNIVDVEATATSRALAAEIANTYTTLFVKEQENSNHAYYASALKLVNKQLAALSPREKAGTGGWRCRTATMDYRQSATMRYSTVHS